MWCFNYLMEKLYKPIINYHKIFTFKLKIQKIAAHSKFFLGCVTSFFQDTPRPPFTSHLLTFSSEILCGTTWYLSCEVQSLYPSLTKSFGIVSLGEKSMDNIHDDGMKWIFQLHCSNFLMWRHSGKLNCRNYQTKTKTNNENHMAVCFKKAFFFFMAFSFLENVHVYRVWQ